MNKKIVACLCLLMVAGIVVTHLNSNVTRSGIVTIEMRVVTKVTAVMTVVSFSYFRQRMVP